MLSKLIFALLAVLSRPDAEGLQRTAPSYLTTEEATVHALAARVAGIVYDVDADILLAIAYRESRYQVKAIGPEAGKRFSCGVMQPTPTKDRLVCAQMTSSVLAGYLAGARHMRDWLDACRGNERCAQVGYAGGYALLKLCETKTVRGCRAPSVIHAWAAGIQRSRTLGARSIVAF